MIRPDDDPVGPRPVGEPLDRLLGHLKAPDARSLGELERAWARVVGADLAPVTKLVGVRSGELVVSTAEPAVASELAWREREIAAAATSLGVPVERVAVRLERGGGDPSGW